MATINLDYGPGGSLNPRQANGELTVGRVELYRSGQLIEYRPDGSLLYFGSLSARIGRTIELSDTFDFVAPPEGIVTLTAGSDTLRFGHDGQTASERFDQLGRVNASGFYFADINDFGTEGDVIRGLVGVEIVFTGRAAGFEQLLFDPGTRANEVGVFSVRREFNLATAVPVFGSPGTDRLELDAFPYLPTDTPTIDLDLRQAPFAGLAPSTIVKLPLLGIDPNTGGVSPPVAPGSNPTANGRLSLAGAPDHVAVVNFLGEVLAHDNVPLHAVAAGEATVTGSQHGDLIDGGSGPLTADGQSGDDSIVGTPEIDRIDGGSGDDVVVYRNGPVTVDLGDGLVETGGDAQGDLLISVEGVLGSPDDDWLAGNELGNWLHGGAGADVLIGRGGNDTLIGGPGRDVAFMTGQRDHYDQQLRSGFDLTLTGRDSGSTDGTDSFLDVEVLLFAFNDYVTVRRLAGYNDPLVDATLVLDYSKGSALNPLDLQGNARVHGLDLDTANNTYTEFDATGTAVGSGELFGGLAPGNVPSSSERFGIVLPPEGGLVLGPGDDAITADPTNADAHGVTSYAFVDGGDGHDRVGGRAGAAVGFETERLAGFETVMFDAEAKPGVASEIVLRMRTEAPPAWQVLGSLGIDTLTLRFDPDLQFPPPVYTVNLLGLEGVGFSTAAWPGPGNDHLQVVLAPTTRGHLVFVPSTMPTIVDGADGDDWLHGGDARNILFGGGGNDRLFGGSAMDGLFGGAGNDLLEGGAGDDFISGDNYSGPAAGTDTAVYSGPRSAYVVHHEPPLYENLLRPDFLLEDTRPGGDGTDSIVGIERFRFNDGEISLAELLAGPPPPPVIEVSIDTAASQFSTLEGSTAAGVLRVMLTHDGASPLHVSGSYRLVADSDAGADSASADDLAVAFGSPIPFDFQGETQLELLIPLVPDLLPERDETLYFELVSASPAVLGQVQRLQLSIVDDDPYTLDGASSVAEGSPWTLTVQPRPGDGYAAEYRIDWGDGVIEVQPGSLLAAAQGRLEHRYADGSSAGTAHNALVTARFADGSSHTLGRSVTVQDVAPTLDASGSPTAEVEEPWTLSLGPYFDPGLDALQSLTLDWGDGSPPTVLMAPLPSSVDHVFKSAGDMTVHVRATNDDGTFLVDTQVVQVQHNFEVQFVGMLPIGRGHEALPQLGAGLTLERSGDLSRDAYVRILIDDQVDGRGTPISPSDLGATAFPIERLVYFWAGRAVASMGLGAIGGDGAEPTETMRVRIVPGLEVTDIGVSDTAYVELVDEQAPFVGFHNVPPVLVEGGANLQVSHHTPVGMPPPTAYLIDWGDGSPLQQVPVAAHGGPSNLNHAYADGTRPVGLPVMVSLTAIGEAPWPVTTQRQFWVVDRAPQLDANGEGRAESGQPYTLHLGPYFDVPGDPLIELQVDWGDGSAPQVLTPPLPASLTHVYPSWGRAGITLQAHNDDGVFEVDRVQVDVGAGVAPPTAQTPAQLAAAWSDPQLRFFEDSDRSTADGWVPVTLRTSGGGLAGAAGGDLYLLGGRPLLGVSGRSATGTTDYSAEGAPIAQMIDGREGLRIDLAGQRATSLELRLALLFQDDPTGFAETARVQLFDGPMLVHEWTVVGNRFFGGEAVTAFDSPAPFDSIVLTAGRYDDNGQFLWGAMTDTTGAERPTPAGAGSDFMLAGVWVGDGVPLVGQPDFGG